MADGTTTPFLDFVLNLGDTPSLILSPPTNVTDVNKGIPYSEERIGDQERVRKLEELRDRVYTARVNSFHWNTTTTFELNGDYRPGGNENARLEVEEVFDHLNQD